MSERGFEALRVKTDTLEVEMLPALGGKVSSLRRNGIELLQAPLRPYALRTAAMGFDESDASGFDECLPSVSECVIAGPSGGGLSPDHGELRKRAQEVARLQPVVRAGEKEHGDEGEAQRQPARHHGGRRGHGERSYSQGDARAGVPGRRCTREAVDMGGYSNPCAGLEAAEPAPRIVPAFPAE